MASDLFGARASLPGMPDLFRINRLDESGAADTQRLPHTLRILLEGLLRNAGGMHVREEDVLALAQLAGGARRAASACRSSRRACCCRTSPACPPSSISPPCAPRWRARAATRRASTRSCPCDLVIDHSVQVDQSGTLQAYAHNIEREYERNRERYLLLRWAQGAFGSFRVVPPGMGIVHQVNLEHLGQGRGRCATASPCPTRSSARTPTRR